MGYTDEKDLPLTWNAKTGENVLWKTMLHGGAKSNPEFASPGWSSPIVWKKRIFITTNIFAAGLTEKERRSTIGEHHLLCFDTETGKQVWDTIVPPGQIVVRQFLPWLRGADARDRRQAGLWPLRFRRAGCP